MLRIMRMMVAMVERMGMIMHVGVCMIFKLILLMAVRMDVMAMFFIC
jgi:hypothetical protein